VNRFLHRIVNWLRVGYPQGIPPTDYMPLLALLSRRLTNRAAAEMGVVVLYAPGELT